MREFKPIPDPSGSLDPPKRRPPTAVGTETPGPEPRPTPRPSIPARRSKLVRALEAVLMVPVIIVGAAVYPFTRKARGRRGGRRS